MTLRKAVRWFQLRRLLCLLVVCWLATFIYLYLSSGPELETHVKDPSGGEPGTVLICRLPIMLRFSALLFVGIPADCCIFNNSPFEVFSAEKLQLSCYYINYLYIMLVSACVIRI